MKVFLSLFLILIVFGGCATSKKRVVAQKKVFPAWYNKPLQSTATTMYALGEGENKSMAVNGALSEILASLRVSITSEFNSKKEVTQGSRESYSVSSSKKITSKVQAIQINNYEVINENDFGFEKYLVQVRIEKQKLFLGLKQELDSKFVKFENEREPLNALEQLKEYKENVKDLENIQNTLSVMYALDSSFDDSLYLKKVADIENQYKELLSNISFSLRTNKDASNLKPSFTKGLSSENFKVSSEDGKNHFKIDITSHTSKAKAYGFNLARSAITIHVKDFKGAIVGSNKINLTGQSTQGYAIAKENVAIKLNGLIEKEGIKKILGLSF